MDARNQWEEGTLGRISPSLTYIYKNTYSRTNFAVNSSAIPTARLADLSPKHKCPLPAAAARFLCGRTLLYPDGQADVAAMCQVIAFTRNTYQSSVSPFSGRLKLLRETDWTLGLEIQ